MSSPANAAPPYWSAADDAELAVLVYEFVNGEADHRQRCSICSQGGPWCGPLVAALEVIISWRHGRILHNKARLLRALQNEQERETELAYAHA